jgi:hypothetical protein
LNIDKRILLQVAVVVSDTISILGIGTIYLIRIDINPLPKEESVVAN